MATSALVALLGFTLVVGATIPTAAPAGATGQSFTWAVKNNVDSSGGRLLAVSCPSTSLCVAVDRAGYAFTSTNPAEGAGSTWASEKLPVCGLGSVCGPLLNDVFCPSTSLCLATGTDAQNRGAVFTSTDPGDGASATWASKVMPAVQLYGVNDVLPAATGHISCPTAGLCLVADPNQHYVLLSSNPAAGGAATWTAETVATSGGYGVNGLACASGTLCVALTSDGHTYVSTNASSGASATWALSSRGYGGTDVACPTASLCVAVTSSGGVWTSTNPGAGASSAWAGAGPDAYSLNGVACPTASLCVAVDQRGRALSSADPGSGTSATWTTQAALNPALSQALYDVACPSPSLCVAVTSTFNDVSGGVAVGTLSSTHALTVATTTKPLNPNAAAYGYVVSSPTGIDCGLVGVRHTNCTTNVASGAQVTLTAVPYTSPTNPTFSYTFDGWTGACTGTGSCTITMDDDKAVTAVFLLSSDTTLTVNKSGTGTGTVTGIWSTGEYARPLDIDCGSKCSAHFTKGSQVVLTATTDAGSTFTGWSGCTRLDAGKCWVTMDGDKAVGAAYTKPTTTNTQTTTGPKTTTPGGSADDWKLYKLVGAKVVAGGHLQLTWTLPPNWENVKVEWFAATSQGTERLPATALTYTTAAVLPPAEYTVQLSAWSPADDRSKTFPRGSNVLTVIVGSETSATGKGPHTTTAPTIKHTTTSGTPTPTKKAHTATKKAHSSTTQKHRATTTKQKKQ